MDEEQDIRNLPTQYEDRTEDLIPRILLVGEEKFLADYIRKELGPRGYVLDQVYEMADAELKLVQFFYRVVFFSVGAESEESRDFISFVKNCCAFSRVIIVAEESNIDASINAIKSGAFDVLTKPIALGKLKSFIMDAISIDKDNVKAISIEPPPGYRIIRQLSSGSFCTVMLAEKDNKFYAIKILSRNLYSMEKLKRFFREAGILATIKSPNILSIYEYGFAEKSEIPYIVMDYLQGKLLSELIVNNTPLPIDKAVRIFKQLAMALETVHGHEILHRDIKDYNKNKYFIGSGAGFKNFIANIFRARDWS
ncbi:MAG: protein kinase [Victivallales bacterium]